MDTKEGAECDRKGLCHSGWKEERDIKRYLLNTNSKKIHDLENSDGRCKISCMREEFKQFFDTLEEAMSFPSSEHPLAQKCSFCFKRT